MKVSSFTFRVFLIVLLAEFGVTGQFSSAYSQGVNTVPVLIQFTFHTKSIEGVQVAGGAMDEKTVRQMLKDALWRLDSSNRFGATYNWPGGSKYFLNGTAKATQDIRFLKIASTRKVGQQTADSIEGTLVQGAVVPGKPLIYTFSVQGSNTVKTGVDQYGREQLALTRWSAHLTIECKVKKTTDLIAQSCPNCGGTGQIICSFCGGTGKHFNAFGNPFKDKNYQAEVNCPSCGGVGKFRCPKCSGTGQAHLIFYE